MSLEKKFNHSEFLDSASFYADNDDNMTGQLSVRLKNGKAFNYYNVPIYVWDDFNNETIANKIFRDVLSKYKSKKIEPEYIDDNLEDIYTEITINDICDIFIKHLDEIYDMVHKFSVKTIYSSPLQDKVNFSFRRGVSKIKRNNLYKYSLFVIDDEGYCNMFDILCNNDVGNYKFIYKLNGETVDNLIIDKIKNINVIKNKIIYIAKKDAMFNR